MRPGALPSWLPGSPGLAPRSSSFPCTDEGTALRPRAPGPRLRPGHLGSVQLPRGATLRPRPESQKVTAGDAAGRPGARAGALQARVLSTVIVSNIRTTLPVGPREDPGGPWRRRGGGGQGTAGGGRHSPDDVPRDRPRPPARISVPSDLSCPPSSLPRGPGHLRGAGPPPPDSGSQAPYRKGRSTSRSPSPRSCRPRGTWGGTRGPETRRPGTYTCTPPPAPGCLLATPHPASCLREPRPPSTEGAEPRRAEEQRGAAVPRGCRPGPRAPAGALAAPSSARGRHLRGQRGPPSLLTVGAADTRGMKGVLRFPRPRSGRPSPWGAPDLGSRVLIYLPGPCHQEPRWCWGHGQP